MQTTKPNIPTKNKNSADPDIRKFRDSEVNAIVAGFQQVDDNFDEVETELGEIIPPRPSQIFNKNGLATIGSVYETESTGTLTFETSKIRGSRTAPEYHFLTLPASLTTDQKKHLNNVIVNHSGLVVPAALVPNKPSSPLAVYAGLTNPVSPLATYADQAAMTADFANQVLDSYYYYTGSNTAWKYDGTATDSIDNYTPELYMLGDQSAQVTDSYYEYTGSTSMWLKTAASTGAIGDYTELEEVTGWETWGAKPSYLIVQGDAYLVGEDNINELSFVYHDLIKIDSVSYADVVVVTNTAHTSMNADANRVINNSIILANFNENDDPVQPDSVNNESIYADFFPFNVTRPEQASYVDLTGGNYSFDIGTNSNTVSARTTLEIAVSEQGQLAMNPDEITIISRANYRTSGTAQNRGIYISRGVLNGLDFYYTEATSLLSVSYIDVGGTQRTHICDVATPLNPIDNGYWVFAVSIKWDGANTLVEYFCKSSDNSVAFQKLGPTDQRAERPNLVSDQIVFDRLGFASSTSRPISIDYMQVVPKALTEAEILAIANTID